MRHPQVLSIFSILLFSVGCGGSNNKPTTPPDTGGGGDDPITLELNGISADGYLRGATVCVDTDEDGSCAGEDSATTTGEGGKFVLTATAEDFEAYSVITEVTVDTIDEDTITDENPQGTPVAAEETYTLSSPPGIVSTTDENGDGVLEGVVFVSPISTLVDHERKQILKQTPDSTNALAQAQTKLAEKLGTTESALAADYVAAQKDTNADNEAKANAQQLHVAARVIAKQLANSKADIADAVAHGALTNDDSTAALDVALNKILERLEDIKNQITEALEALPTDAPEAHAEAVANAVQAISNANDVINPDSVSDLVTSAKTPTETTTAAEVLQREGGVWLVGIEGIEADEYYLAEDETAEVWVDNIGYVPAAGETPAKSIDNCFDLNIETRELETSENDAFTHIGLTDNGWAEVNEPAGDDCHLEFTLTEAGGVEGSFSSESVSIAPDARNVELEGRSIAGLHALYDTLSKVHWPLVIKENSTFSAGAEGFVLSGTASEEAEYSLGSPDNISTLGYQLGHDLFQVSFSSLDFIVHEAGTQLINADGTLDEELAFIDVGMSNGAPPYPVHLSVYLSGTTATFFSRQFNGITSQMESRILGTTTFTVETIKGERILRIPTIKEIKGFDLYHSVDDVASGKPFVFTEYADAVRSVYFEPEESESFSVLALNQTARDDLIQALNTDRFAIRANIPANIPALKPLVGAAFGQTTDPHYYTSQWKLWWNGSLAWGVSNAITDPVNGEGSRTVPFPLGFFRQEHEVITLTITEGLFASAETSITRIFDNEISLPIDFRRFFVVYATDSEGEGDSQVTAGCSKTLDEIRRGDFSCGPALSDAGAFFVSLSKTAIEAKALELTASAQTIAFDREQFIGKTFYALEFDPDDIDKIAITLNDDEGKTVSVVGSGITASSLTYELNDYGVQISGTREEDGVTDTISDFLFLREYHEADEVYLACWKGKYETEDGVTDVSEAIYSCAADSEDDRVSNIITFSKEKADALEDAGEFIPSS